MLDSPWRHAIPYLYLLIAILAEVTATSALKSSEGFTRLVPSVVVVTGYGIAFWLLSLSLKSIPIGITYAAWSGIGTVALAVVGAVVFKQKLDAPAVVGMALIIAGVLVMNLVSRTAVH